jgi:hypothetical protein
MGILVEQTDKEKVAEGGLAGQAPFECVNVL